MIQRIKSSIRQNFMNAQGWHTNRKILVIESDDWGSIRIPNKKMYNELENSVLGNTLSLYDKLDGLESRGDFQNLLDIADQFNDRKGNPLIYTLNVVMQNPNFAKIRASEYEEFFGIPFFESYKQYYGEELQDLWFGGMEKNLIRPQFHAREHLNEYLWLKDLKNGNKALKLAFDKHFFALKTETSSLLRQHYLATYFSETPEEFERVSKGLREGLQIFKTVFGYNSETFIASNYSWPKELELILARNKVKGIQTQFGNTITNFKSGKTTTGRFYTGEKNESGQFYTVRNVLFEPYLNQNKDWVNSALAEVRNSFFWKKPAIVCMHRVNFASELDMENRDKSLKALKKFIRTILKNFPEVEFMSSDQLIRIIENDGNSQLL